MQLSNNYNLRMLELEPKTIWEVLTFTGLKKWIKQLKKWNFIYVNTDKEFYSINFSQKTVRFSSKPAFFRSIGEVIYLSSCGEPSYKKEVKITPAFKHRALMVDQSRNAVFKVQTYKSLLSHMALCGYNFLSIYMEDTLENKNFPYVGWQRGRLTPGEISEICEFAAELGIEVFPSIQTFGHMRKILNHPPLKKLAEVEDGDSIIPGDEQTYKFLEKWMEPAVLYFPSRYINLGMDEVWDLGKGKSFQRVCKEGKEKIYLEHAAKVLELARKFGKQPMMWGDMLREIPPEDLKTLGDVTVLNWNYEENPPADKLISYFKDAGLAQWVCPGFQNWSRIVPSYSIARKNITKFLKEAKRQNVEGFMVTWWGDDGAESIFELNLPLVHGAGNMGWRLKWEGERIKALLQLKTEPEEIEPPSPAFEKMVLWDDPVKAKFCLKISDPEGTSKKFKELAKKCENTHVLNFAAKLYKVNSFKVLFPFLIREAYRAEKKHLLFRLIKKLKKEIKKLASQHIKRWLERNKFNGVEFLSMKYNFLLGVLDALQTHLKAQELDYVEELKESEYPAEVHDWLFVQLVQSPSRKILGD